MFFHDIVLPCRIGVDNREKPAKGLAGVDPGGTAVAESPTARPACTGGVVGTVVTAVVAESPTGSPASAAGVESRRPAETAAVAAVAESPTAGFGFDEATPWLPTLAATGPSLECVVPLPSAAGPCVVTTAGVVLPADLPALVLEEPEVRVGRVILMGGWFQT